MAIDAEHGKYSKFYKKWKRIDDVLDMDDVDDYLVELNPLDISAENKKRNEQYQERAVFYGLAGQTCAGMVGTLFRKEPALNVDTALKYVGVNIDGAGTSIYQQAQQAARHVVGKSRCGLLVAYPPVDTALSMADVQSGNYNATVTLYNPKNIINWAVTAKGSNVYLNLVVLREVEVTHEDYAVKEMDILRELFIDEDGIYKERKWVKVSDKWVAGDTIIPRKANGQVWNEIPFTFIGAVNNDWNVDVPAMLPLVDLNIAHYRNSADYEDSVWYCGQAQAWMSGITEDHVKFMKDKKQYIGSRELLGVPSGEQFGFAAAPANPAVRQAMLDKVDMMVGLGARMLTVGGVAKTAAQTDSEREVQHSPLSLMGQNISDAYTKALSWMAEYMGATVANNTFEINTDFAKASGTPAEIKEMIAGFIAGAVPTLDYVLYMQRNGYFQEDVPAKDYADQLGQR